MNTFAPFFPTGQTVPPLLPGKSFTGPVLWFNHGLPCGGVERQILTTAGEFVRRGISLHLLCETLSPQRGYDFFLPEARRLFKGIHSLTPVSKIVRRHLPAAIRAAHHLCGLPECERAVIAMYAAFFMALRPRLAQFWNADHLLPPLAAVLAGVPRIIICGRCLSPRIREPQGLESANEHFARLALTFLLQHQGVTLTNNSTPGCVDYADWLGLPQHRVVFTPNAFDAEAWPPPGEGAAAAFRKSLDIPEDAPIIGGLCRVVPVKDPGLWANAAAAILQRNPAAVAVLGGDGPLFSELRQAIAQTSLAHRFRLPGAIRDSAPFYRACSVFLLTSLVEGMPNVVLEAQYHKVPVVSTPAGGVVDIIEHGRTGFVVAERDPLALAAHADYVLRTPAWAAQAGERASARVLKLFSKKRTGDIFLGLYQEEGQREIC